MYAVLSYEYFAAKVIIRSSNSLVWTIDVFSVGNTSFTNTYLQMPFAQGRMYMKLSMRWNNPFIVAMGYLSMTVWFHKALLLQLEAVGSTNVVFLPIRSQGGHILNPNPSGDLTRFIYITTLLFTVLLNHPCYANWVNYHKLLRRILIGWQWLGINT